MSYQSNRRECNLIVYTNASFKDKKFYVAGIETKFAGSSCNDLVTSDGAGSTIISGHFDQRIRFWDTRAESSSNDILLEGKVTSLDLSRGK